MSDHFITANISCAHCYLHIILLWSLRLIINSLVILSKLIEVDIFKSLFMEAKYKIYMKQGADSLLFA